ncbi:hypothetical protein SO802_034060 [Lithocarpus litseifolius]|uniref:Uncharacterized protein n=1 Tax=Lithocarpus litseifolius TaxID=425828 RepID=A0AAW2BI54_9ROSI
MLMPYDFFVITGLRLGGKRILVNDSFTSTKLKKLLGVVPSRVWMYEYFGVGLEIREEVAGIFPRFLLWLPKHHLSIPSKRSLEIWRLVIDNLTINDMNLNPWVGCEEYAEYEQALELNGHQVLFECEHGKYWYLDDWVLPQVELVYPPTIIPTPPCRTVRFADFLVDKEIA